MSRKTLAVFLRAGALAGWALVAFLWIHMGLWIFFAVYFALHLFESFTVGLKRGRAAGRSDSESMLKTFIFGFTWWYFLEK